jgi:hypothetical protein
MLNVTHSANARVSGLPLYSTLSVLAVRHLTPSLGV